MSTKRNPLSESAQGGATRNDEKSWKDGTSSSNQSARHGSAHLKQSRAPSSCSMEILVPADDNSWLASGQNYSQKKLGGRSRSNVPVVSARSDSCSTPRVVTPTRHVTQTAVRRKEQSEKPVEPELDWREFTRSVLHPGDGASSKAHPDALVRPLHAEDWKAPLDSKFQADELDANLRALRPSSDVKQAVHDDDQGDACQAWDERNRDRASHDGGEGHETDEQESRTAPSELLLEFLQCLMKKDYTNAEKLCRMILIYEPNNPEALKFHPVILEKIELEKQERGESHQDEETSDDDGSDEESDESSDSSSESSDDSSNDSFVDDLPRPDSGIGM